MSSISGTGSNTINPLLNTPSITPTTQGKSDVATTVYLDLGSPKFSVDLLGIQLPRSPEDSEMLLLQILEATETLIDKARSTKFSDIADALRDAATQLAGIQKTMETQATTIATDKTAIADVKSATDTYNSAKPTADQYQSSANGYEAERVRLVGLKNQAIADGKPQSVIDSYNTPIANATSSRDTAQNNANYYQGQANTAANQANTWLADHGGSLTKNIGESDKAFAARIMSTVETKTQNLQTEITNTTNAYNDLQPLMLTVFSKLASALLEISKKADLAGVLTDDVFAKLKDKVEDIPVNFNGTSNSVWGDGSSENVDGGGKTITLADKIKQTAISLVAGISEIFSALSSIDALNSDNEAGLEATNNRFRLSI